VSKKKESEGHLLLGRKRMGKTTLARAILAGHPKRFIVDPRGEHKGDHVAHSFVQLCRLFEDGTIDTDRGCTVVYRFKGEQAETMDLVWEFINEALNGWAILIDEIDQFATTHRIPFELWKLLNYNRHTRNEYVLCARRPTRVNRDLTALIDWMHVFRITEANDLKYLEDTCGKSGCSKIHDLQAFQYLTFYV